MGKWAKRQISKSLWGMYLCGEFFVIEGRAGDDCGPGPMAEGKARAKRVKFCGLGCVGCRPEGFSQTLRVCRCGFYPGERVGELHSPWQLPDGNCFLAAGQTSFALCSLAKQKLPSESAGRSAPPSLGYKSRRAGLLFFFHQGCDAMLSIPFRQVSVPTSGIITNGSLVAWSRGDRNPRAKRAKPCGLAGEFHSPWQLPSGNCFLVAGQTSFALRSLCEAQTAKRKRVALSAPGERDCCFSTCKQDEQKR